MSVVHPYTQMTFTRAGFFFPSYSFLGFDIKLNLIERAVLIKELKLHQRNILLALLESMCLQAYFDYKKSPTIGLKWLLLAFDKFTKM